MNPKPFRGYNPVQGARPQVLDYAKPELPYKRKQIRGSMVSPEVLIVCPFCKRETWADDWSFQRQGKKCNCGAHFRQDGIAIART